MTDQRQAKPVPKLDKDGGISLAELSTYLDDRVHGDASTTVSGIGTLKSASSSQLSFFANSKYLQDLKTSAAAAVLLKPADVEYCPSSALVLDNPYFAFAKASHIFDTAPFPSPGIHPSAIVAETASLHNSVSVGANAVIGEHVVIGAGSSIGANCVIEDNVVIGDQCRLRSNVVLYHSIRLGNRVQIHSGSVIGADGFGFAQYEGRSHKIAQIGGVRIGDDVDIGACTSVDRGAIDDTVIEEGVIIDNHVQIAHNVRVGAHTIICGCVGIAGSARIGRYCVLAGQAGISGHIELADHVHVGMQAQVTSSIHQAGAYASGTGLMPVARWRRLVVRLRNFEKALKSLN